MTRGAVDLQLHRWLGPAVLASARAGPSAAYRVRPLWCWLASAVGSPRRRFLNGFGVCRGSQRT
jgi:hypothetical protein